MYILEKINLENYSSKSWILHAQFTLKSNAFQNNVSRLIQALKLFSANCTKKLVRHIIKILTMQNVTYHFSRWCNFINMLFLITKHDFFPFVNLFQDQRKPGDFEFLFRDFSVKKTVRKIQCSSWSHLHVQAKEPKSLQLTKSCQYHRGKR